MLGLRERLFRKEVNEYAKGLNLKAVIFRELRKYNEALELHNQAIIIRENKKELKKDLAVSYNNISLIYSDLKKIGLSLPFAKEALEISENILDCNHFSLAIRYGNISMIYI